MTQTDLTESRVIDWLSEHPDLFDRHPDLLAQLQLPHESGAASLIQRQVERLREDNERLKRQLKHLGRVAGDNEQRMRRLHRLSLALASASDEAELLARLDDGLRGDFRADAVHLAFGDGGPDAEHPALAGLPDPLPDWLAEMLTEARPFCGRLTRDKREALFGDRGADLGSVALVPLSENALLAIGAESDDRFHPDMGTLFLELLSAALRFRLGMEEQSGDRRRARA